MTLPQEVIIEPSASAQIIADKIGYAVIACTDGAAGGQLLGFGLKHEKAREIARHQAERMPGRKIAVMKCSSVVTVERENFATTNRGTP